MRIGIDASRAFGQQRTGTENYSLQIIKELVFNNPDHDFVLFTREDSDRSWPINVSEVRISLPRLWTQVGLAFKTYTEKLDILFIPSHTLPILGNRRIKYVVTIHDLGVQFLPNFDRFPHKYYLDLTTKYAIRHANGLIAVSNKTKKDIVDFLPVAEEKTRVIYEGFDGEFFNPQISTNKVNVVKRKFKLKQYILFVGTIQPRKNLKRLIEAYAVLNKKVKDVDLVIVGKKGWNYEDILALPKKLKINDQVKFLGYVADEYLPGLYKGATLTILPSLYEGFGLPLVESMAVGTPVIAARGSSLTEVVGSGGMLVNPKSVESITESLIKVCKSRTIQLKMSKESVQRSKEFSWTKSAKKTLKFFEDVYGGVV